MKKDKRSKPQLETIKVSTLSEADGILLKISDINATLRGIEATTDLALNAIKDEAREEATPLLEEKERLEKSLAIYAEYNKNELFLDKKTIELTFGLFGYRQSTSISVKATTIELLKKHGFNDAVALKESANKEAMRDWSDERLGLCDARRVVADKFWVEAKQNEVDIKV